MATLTNKRIKNTYDGLLKTNDEEPIPASGTVTIQDGLGNNSAMSLGRSGEGMNINGNLNVSGEVEISDTVLIEGDTTISGSDLSVQQNVSVGDKLSINVNSPTHRFELYDNRTDDDSDDYTMVIKTSLPSPIPTPNPGTGGIKAVFSENNGSTFPYGISMVPGTSSCDVMSTQNLAFYSNSDLDTVSATGLRAIMDNAGTKIYGNLEAGDNGCSATGEFAVALNQDTTASGLDALACGEQTTASGRQAFAGGFNTTASGSASFTHGAQTVASGVNSFAVGAETEATQPGSAAFNNQTNATGINSFATGGNTTASGEASLSAGVSSTASGVAAVTTGLSCTSSANGTFSSGTVSRATGLFSTAMGDNCLAQGQASTARGYIAEARGNYAAAIGFNVDANGQSSLAVNQQNVAQGTNSIAGGFQTNVNSNESMAVGFHCKDTPSTMTQNNQFLFGRYLNTPQSAPQVAAGQAQFVVGRHNAYTGQQHTAFAVGNGSGVGTESNAMTVLYNGQVGIGTTTPTAKMDIAGNMKATTGTFSTGVYLGGTSTANLLDDYEEGTWTPQVAGYFGGLTSVTYTQQNGYYTKVGNRVTCVYQLQFQGTTTAGYTFYMYGLPFSLDANQTQIMGTISNKNQITGFGNFIGMDKFVGTTNCVFRLDNGTGITNLATGNLAVSGTSMLLQGVLSYTTT